MNKGFKFYYKDGLRKARKVFKKKKNLLKFYAYVFSSFIPRILLVILPIFTLSDYRMALMIKDGEDISLSKSYAALDKPKTFWTTILAGLNVLLIFFGGIVLILFPTAILFGIGYLVAFILSNVTLSTILPIILASPGALALLIYMIVFPFYIAPVFYIISKVDGVNASDALKNSFNAMKEGKWTLFLLGFVHMLILTLMLGILALIVYVGVIFLPQYLSASGIIQPNVAIMIRGIGAIVSVVPFLLFLRFLPVRISALNVSNIEFYDDMLIGYGDSLQGIYYKGVKVEKVSYKNYKENIVKLFQETKNYSEYQEPKQESVEVVKESTKEEIDEEYLKDEKNQEKIAEDIKKDEEEKPLSKKEQKALKKQNKKNKKNKDLEEPESVSDESKDEVQEETKAEEVVQEPEVQKEPIKEEVQKEPVKEEPKDEPVVEPTTTEHQEETKIENNEPQEKPDFHQEYDNGDDEPIFKDDEVVEESIDTNEGEAQDEVIEEHQEVDEAVQEEATSNEEPQSSDFNQDEVLDNEDTQSEGAQSIVPEDTESSESESDEPKEE